MSLFIYTVPRSVKASKRGFPKITASVWFTGAARTRPDGLSSSLREVERWGALHLHIQVPFENNVELQQKGADQHLLIFDTHTEQGIARLGWNIMT